ncbi:MAG: putative peptidoglycan lipid II flippase, partial [Flavobacteriaceae bacterium]
MVKKVFNFLTSRVTKTSQAALLLGLFSLLAKFVAIFRDRALAYYIGPGETLDIYYSAFQIPDIVFLVAGSFVAVSVIIPLLHSKEGEVSTGIFSDKEKKFFNSVFSGFLIFVFGISLIAFVFMPFLVRFTAPGLVDASRQELILLSRIMLASPILLGLSTLFGSIVQKSQRFVLLALAPILYNIGILAGILFLYPLMGSVGLVVGVIVGALLHLLVQMPACLKLKYFPICSFKPSLSDIKEVFKLSIPRTLGVSFNQLSLIMLIALASTFVSGSVSLFRLSFNLQSIALGVIGASYAVAVFPVLSSSYVHGHIEEFKKQFQFSLYQIIFWSLPLSALFIVLRAHIVRVILGTSNFDWSDTRITAGALALFALSFVSQGVVLLCTKTFYAMGKTMRPVLLNTIGFLLTLFFTWLFLFLFNTHEVLRNMIEGLLRVRGARGTELLMLPLAFSVGSLLNMFLVLFFLRKDVGFKLYFWKPFIQLVVGACATGLFAYLFLHITPHIFNTTTFQGLLLQGICAGIVGMIGGWSILYILSNKELLMTTASFRRRFKL